MGLFILKLDDVLHCVASDARNPCGTLKRTWLAPSVHRLLAGPMSEANVVGPHAALRAVGSKRRISNPNKKGPPRKGVGLVYFEPDDVLLSHGEAPHYHRR